jgi:hypothetical protein
VTIPEVYSLAINGNDIWASTSKGIYMSSDNGDEWYQKGSIYGKAITISGNNIISGGYYSKNNGITWTPSNFPNHSAISFAQGSKSLFAATGSGVIQSFDNGVSWSLFNYGLGLDSLNIRSLTICGNNLYGGGRGVWKTTLTSSIVKEKTWNNNYKIFPNPSKGIFNIQKNGKISANQSIEVYNMIGEQIYSTISTQLALDSFDISAYPIGIYILKINDANNSYSLKIIKE